MKQQPENKIPGSNVASKRWLTLAGVTAVFFLLAFLLTGTPYSSVPPMNLDMAPMADVHPPPPMPVQPVEPPRPPLEDEIARLVEAMDKLAASSRLEDLTYTVEKGESLHVIARKIKSRYDLSESSFQILEAIHQRNGIANPRTIRTGTRLTIPLSEFNKSQASVTLDERLIKGLTYVDFLNQCLPAEPPERRFGGGPERLCYTVQPGDSLYTLARRFKDEAGLSISLQGFVQEIAWRNDIGDPTNVYPGTELEIALTNERTMGAMLTYDGFHARNPAGKLRYSREEILAFVDGALARYDNVPRQVFLKMLAVESGGRHLAVSPVGAGGLMQIMPLTARKLGLKLWNPNGYKFPHDISSPGAKSLYQKYGRELQDYAKHHPYKLMEEDDRFLPQRSIYAAIRLLSRAVRDYGLQNAVAMYNGGSRGTSAARAEETKKYMNLVLN